MKLKQLFADEEAVSPVIGVILMVAITVILAAVIGTFVLGLGDQVQNTAPQASFTFDYNDGTTGTPAADCGGSTFGSDGTLNVTHDGGDKVAAADLDLSDGSTSVNYADDCGFGTDSDVTAGDTQAVEVASGDTIRVIWNAGEDDSATLGKWTGPDA